MRILGGSLVSWVAAGTLLISSSAAWAGSAPAGKQCDIGRFIPSTSNFRMDLDKDGTWDGVSGGDRSVVIGPGGAGAGILADWNNDMIDNAGKVNGDTYRTDHNGSNTWDGPVGGDRAIPFALFEPTFLPLADKFVMGLGAVVAKYVVASSKFVIDRNGDGDWDGGVTDLSVVIAATAGAGTMLTGDWDNNGVVDTGKVVGSTFYLDFNGNGVWEGAGTDRRTGFAPGKAGVGISGKWVAGEGDKIGKFDAATSTFYLDFDGDGVWDGPAGGDVVVVIAKQDHGGSTVNPLICDFDGDGDDNVGKNVDSIFWTDFDGDNVWDGTAGGDRRTGFSSGGTGNVGVWSTP